METFVTRWCSKACASDFTKVDCAIALDKITDDAKTFFPLDSNQFSDDLLFDIFNCVVLRYAENVENEPQFSQIVLGGTMFPWGSFLTLLYPVMAMLYILSTPAQLPYVIGYTIFQLGYLLIASGIFVGTFRILGLNRRLHIFIAAAICMAVGLYLVNI